MMDSLVSTRWLADQLGADDLVVLDATMHLPDNPRDAAAEYAAAHVSGARWLDLESFVDAGSPVPKAVPTAEQFADRLGSLGITPESRVVLYDDSQIKSAARGWFVFRLYGFAKVAILDGGLAKWKAEGRALEAGQTEVARAEFGVPRREPGTRSKAEIMANCGHGSEQVVDARDAARYAGETGSGSAGHIPGAANVPFPLLFAKDGTYRAPEQIAALFAEAGIALDRPVVTSCNSGMTAAVLAFGLHLAGKQDVALYDGSWLEWGSDPDTPKEQGAAR